MEGDTKSSYSRFLPSMQWLQQKVDKEQKLGTLSKTPSEYCPFYKAGTCFRAAKGRARFFLASQGTQPGISIAPRPALHAKPPVPSRYKITALIIINFIKICSTSRPNKQVGCASRLSCNLSEVNRGLTVQPAAGLLELRVIFLRWMLWALCYLLLPRTRCVFARCRHSLTIQLCHRQSRAHWCKAKV